MEVSKKSDFGPRNELSHVSSPLNILKTFDIILVLGTREVLIKEENLIRVNDFVKNLHKETQFLQVKKIKLISSIFIIALKEANYISC